MPVDALLCRRYGVPSASTDSPTRMSPGPATGSGRSPRTRAGSTRRTARSVAGSADDSCVEPASRAPEAQRRRARAVDHVRVGYNMATVVDEPRRAGRNPPPVAERRVVGPASCVYARDGTVDAVIEFGEGGLGRGPLGGRRRPRPVPPRDRRPHLAARSPPARGRERRVTRRGRGDGGS